MSRFTWKLQCFPWAEKTPKSAKVLNYTKKLKVWAKPKNQVARNESNKNRCSISTKKLTLISTGNID